MGRGYLPGRSIPSFPQVFARNRVVADGEDNFSTINDALTAASDYVIIGPGTYNESVSITTDGLVMVGSGNATTIDGGSSTVIDVDADDTQIRNLSITTTGGDGYNANGDNNIVSRVTVFDSGQHGVRFSGGRFNLSFACRVDACTNTAYLSNANNGNTFAYPHWKNGVGTNGVDIRDDLGVVIGGNGFGAGLDGIFLRGIRNVAFACPFVLSSDQQGIRVGGDDCRVAFCNVDDSGDNGIIVTGADDVLIGNTVTNSTDDEIDLNAATNPRGYGNSPRMQMGQVNGPLNVTTGELQIGGHPVSDRVQALVDNPERIENEPLNAGDDVGVTELVPDGQTLKVYRWGAYQVSDGTAPTDLDVELQDGTGTVQATENTPNTESTDPANPVASHTNSSGSASVFRLQAVNDTGGNITDPGVGAVFGFLVE